MRIPRVLALCASAVAFTAFTSPAMAGKGRLPAKPAPVSTKVVTLTSTTDFPDQSTKVNSITYFQEATRAREEMSFMGRNFLSGDSFIWETKGKSGDFAGQLKSLIADDLKLESDISKPTNCGDKPVTEWKLEIGTRKLLGYSCLGKLPIGTIAFNDLIKFIDNNRFFRPESLLS